MGRLAEEKSKNENKLMEFKVGNTEVKLSQNIVKKYLVNGNGNITEQEIMYFMQLCKARNLNPFVKDVYLIKLPQSLYRETLLKKELLNMKHTTGKKLEYTL